ncbi:MAG: histidine kinase, partial [Bacteroidetes bacterium]|nr:histidine kinase [Bacteroidota bacterium]
ALIEDLLAYSHADSEKVIFEKTDINEIVKEIKDEFNEEFHAKGAKIQAHKLPVLNVIRFQFHQLLHNLISNALKFSDPKRPLQITINSEMATGNKFKNEHLNPQKKYYHITISDNGIGFEPRFSDRIFEVFQRLHGKDEYKGTGIGLAICKKIVENHHGFITASAELKKGATFDIYLPMTL